MELITDEIRKRLPKLYATREQSNPMLHVKFFTPWTSWTWYVAEFDGEDLFFGFVEGLEAEWGYFRLSELEAITGPEGLRIERDLHFEPMPASEIDKLHPQAK